MLDTVARRRLKLYKWTRAALKAAWHRTATVNLIVTRRCDLKCSYCHSLGKGDEIDAASWLAIAKRLAHRFSAFTVSGGEPLLYRQLPELIDGLAKVGIAGLCSNLRQIRPHHLEALKSLDYLNFSIDHLGSSEKGDRSSRKNAFGMLDELTAFGRRNGVTLCGTAVITRRNVEDIEGVATELTQRGIPLNLQLVQHPPAEDAFSTPEELTRLGLLSRELIAMKRGGYLIDETAEYLSGFVDFVAGETQVRCHAGRVYLAVDTDGRLMPCQACRASGPSLLEIEDLERALIELPKAVPAQCRCWWNCYHWYAEWHQNPLRHMARRGLALVRPPRSRRTV